MLLHCFTGVIIEGFSNQLTVSIVILNSFIQLFNRDTGDLELDETTFFTASICTFTPVRFTATGIVTTGFFLYTRFTLWILILFYTVKLIDELFIFFIDNIFRFT